jgi:hypothetical protein
VPWRHQEPASIALDATGFARELVHPQKWKAEFSVLFNETDVAPAGKHSLDHGQRDVRCLTELAHPRSRLPYSSSFHVSRTLTRLLTTCAYFSLSRLEIQGAWFHDLIKTSNFPIGDLP